MPSVPHQPLEARSRSGAQPEAGDEILERALALHRQGDLAGAQACYERLLHREPRHLDALNSLAMIAYQTGQHDRAIELIDRAIEIDPANAAFYSNRGILLQERLRTDAAIASYDQAIGLKPDFAQAYCNRAVAQVTLRRYEDAVHSCDGAIAAMPEYAEAHYNRALALKALGRVAEALQSCQRAIDVRPDYAEAHFCRGGLLHELGQPAAALASYDRAIALRPGYAEAHSNRGLALQQLGQMDAALASFDRAISLQPEFAQGHYNLGVLLQALKRMEAAMACYDRTIALKADHAPAYANRGSVRQALGQIDAALSDYDRALALEPGLVEARTNRGTAQQEMLHMDEAMACFDMAVSSSPEYALGHWNRSLACLLLGDFAEGWQEYEWRWNAASLAFPRRDFAQPLWLGRESIAGKTILLHAEQGLGDTIQLCRYVPMVAQLGASVILEVQAPLIGLLAGSLGIASLVARGSRLPPFDCHCPVFSLPLALQTRLATIPSYAAYLRVDPAKTAQWRSALGSKVQPRIGLVWSGSASHVNDRNRSLALSELVEHLPRGFEYVSLQREVRESDQSAMKSRPDIRHFGDRLADFTDTAALCELMDLVISVDTSVAHLGGALGKPVWILLPFSPDWRWLLKRDDSPWYPSAKLYRQHRMRDWSNVIRQVGVDLKRIG
jgi:tetratricopeptide (TPR) repeat protein